MDLVEDLMIVYCATNKITGRRYVGVSVRGSLAKRMNEHKSRALAGVTKCAFSHAIRKHGWDAFSWEILERCETREALQIAERQWIERLASAVERHGYNRTAGGGGVVGYVFSADVRARISHALRGRVKSDETRAKLSAALKGRPLPVSRKGAKHTPEAIAKMRAAKLGKRYAMSEDGRRGMKAAAQRRAKITAADIVSVRARRDAGETWASIGATYGATGACARQSLRRT